MKFKRTTLANCQFATGVVVVIDVLRAFTTAAYAFSSGAERIYLVRGIEEAFALKKKLGNAVIMGENDGLPVKGFDYGNSPTEIASVDLRGLRVIQRTTAGTQGAVLTEGAKVVLASSFAVAGATAEYLRVLTPSEVTFVITGAKHDEDFSHKRIKYGDEDQALADYLEALLKEEKPDPKVYLQRVYYSRAGKHFLDPKRPEFPITDLAYATDLDNFNFLMQVERKDDQVLLKPLYFGRG